MRRIALLMLLALAGEAGPMSIVQARLARGDASGAAVALAAVSRPPVDRPGDLAAWLDAQSRIAWAQGRLDEAFARATLAQAFAERAGLTLAPLDAALGTGRAWIDASTGLPARALPAGDAGEGRGALVRELADAVATGPDAAWLGWVARLLDPSQPAPVAAPRPAKETPAEIIARRRASLLQAACQARSGDAAQSIPALRACLREAESARATALWFEAEALLRDGPRRDPRLASLRFAQAAAEFDAAPHMRVAALRRAAAAIDAIDPPEAARLRAAADQETP